MSRFVQYLIRKVFDGVFHAVVNLFRNTITIFKNDFVKRSIAA